MSTGVDKIAARTPNDLGSTKVDAVPVTSEHNQVPAEQYNRLADYVIELQSVIGTADNPAPGTVAQKLDEAGSSDKIQDTAGTTRVETEEEADKATVTANGQRVFTMGEDRTDWEAAPDPVTGNTTTEATGAGAYAPGVTGKYIAIRNALNELIGHLAMLRGGPGEGLALLRVMHEASVDSGAGLENFLQSNDGAESVLKARSVLGRGALVELFADDTGVVSAQLKGSGLTSSARVVATDEDVYFEGHGSAPIHLNEASHVSLPAGMTSLVQGLTALDATKPQEWTPSWSGLANVDGTPTTNEGSIKVEGDYVDIEVEVEIESLGSGPVAATAPLPGGIDPPTRTRFGQGTAVYDGSNFVAVLCQLETDGTLTVGLTAAGADVHTACVRLRYLRDDS